MNLIVEKQEFKMEQLFGMSILMLIRIAYIWRAKNIGNNLLRLVPERFK